MKQLYFKLIQYIHLISKRIRDKYHIEEQDRIHKVIKNLEKFKIKK